MATLPVVRDRDPHRLGEVRVAAPDVTVHGFRDRRNLLSEAVNGGIYIRVFWSVIAPPPWIWGHVKVVLR